MTINRASPSQKASVTATSRITFDPAHCAGRPCIAGQRIRVRDVLELLAAGSSRDEILTDYPYLETEDIRACLTFAVARP